MISRRNCSFSCAAAALAFVIFGVAPTQAVIISGGDGTGNVNAPPDDFGFANVGRVFNTSDQFFNTGVYLGSGFVLSAYHVVRDGSSTGFLFGSVLFKNSLGSEVAFDVDPASAVRLKNADNTVTDLAVFRLTTTPSFLTGVTISSVTPPAGASLILAGNGVNRASTETHWNVDTAPNPDLWTETSTAGDRQGYKFMDGQTLRYGTNTLESNILPTNRTFVINDGFSTVTAIKTDFDRITNEAQGVDGDSGGGVFYKNGNRWELAGTIVARDLADGQPLKSVAFSKGATRDNYTFAADLPTYRSQIAAIIPEPATGVLTLASCALLGLRRRARKS